MSDKAALRQRARERRKEAYARVDAAPALAALEVLLGQYEGIVAGFMPIRTEIDPRPLLERLARMGRELCLPVTVGADRPLLFRAWRPGDALSEDTFGVSAPVGGEEVRPHVLIVPLLAFDRAGHRLGYGGGHYDRTLHVLRESADVTAIGLAYAAQETKDPLPVEATDQRLDAIVTEIETITFPGRA